MRILHAASECIPLAKTGGLADVLGALPLAQAAAGHTVCIALPAYRGTGDRLGHSRVRAELQVRGQRFQVIEGQLGQARVWLLDCPALYDRPGDPYHGPDSREHADNAWRFACFSQACVQLAQGAVDGWRAEVVHAHDWQTGPALAWLADAADAPDTPAPLRVFTLHNLAYLGRFPAPVLSPLELPAAWWGLERGEFYGDLSFLKLGITAAQAITTVSPRYAQEIRTAEFGCGLEGLLQARAGVLSGILNGIDERVWDPRTDPHLARRYGARDVEAGKRANRSALCQDLQLNPDAGALLVGVIGRFTGQKGFDLLLEALPRLIEEGLCFAVLGSGDRTLESAYRALAERHPGRIGLRLGYDESLAHRIEAGADAFLMPSRFEPCGLNQMYSQRYGTVPVVRRVGGLADTVTDATPATLADGSATGVCFEHADVGGVLYGLRRAAALRQEASTWKQIQRAGMARDFSWTRAADDYLELYASVIVGDGARQRSTLRR